MIWYALILAIVVGSLFGLFTRNLGKALKITLLTFLFGVVLSLLMILSGVLGG